MILSIIIGGYLYYYWIIIIPVLLIAPLVFFMLYKHLYKKSLVVIELISFWSTVLLLGWLGSYIAANIESFIYSIKYPSLYTYGTNKIFEGQRFYGSLVFTLAYFILLKKESPNFKRMMDVSSITLCILLFFGKIGCFISAHTGCAGTFSHLPWACIFKNEQTFSELPQHPKQLYDAIFYLLFFILSLAMHKKYFSSDGITFLIFLFIIPTYLFLIGFISAEKVIYQSFRLSHVFSVILFILSFNYLNWYRKSIEKV